MCDGGGGVSVTHVDTPGPQLGSAWKRCLLSKTITRLHPSQDPPHHGVTLKGIRAANTS